MSEFMLLHCVGPEYSSFLSDTLSWLWSVVGNPASNPATIAAAYTAIASFPLEATKLKMLPPYARQGVKLPPAYCATPADAAR